MIRVSIVGSGFSSLSAACYLAKQGYKVTVFEKNEQLGGRARMYEENGFRFDMGPSWYWMPDIFDRFFSDFDRNTSDFYNLIRLDPGYKVFFDNKALEVPASIEDIYALFENEELGGADKLKKFIKKAQYNYETSMSELVYKPGESILELVTPQTVTQIGQFVKSIRVTIRKDFTNERLIQILEFPVLFLGAKPENTPAFYSFMNYADLVLGTWYPMGGMHKIVEAMVDLGRSLGVTYHTNSDVQKIRVNNNQVESIKVNGTSIPTEVVLSGADYHHTETLLEPMYRSYSHKYWEAKTFAPSALIFYLGFNKKLKKLRHHNLFFDESFDQHAQEIYDVPAWPKKPLFYASFPSITDDSVAPEGCENGFILMPIAPGLEDSEHQREQYFESIIQRLESHSGQEIRNNIVLKKSYCVADFKQDYNAYKGNAYGMANTLKQTAFLRPKIKSSKVENLYFTGQLTVPGPGVPPALISGKIAAQSIHKNAFKTLAHGDI